MTNILPNSSFLRQIKKFGNNLILKNSIKNENDNQVDIILIYTLVPVWQIACLLTISYHRSLDDLAVYFIFIQIYNLHVIPVSETLMTTEAVDSSLTSASIHF